MTTSEKRSLVLRTAHQLVKKGLDFGTAQRKAWKAINIKEQLQQGQTVTFQFTKTDGTTRTATGQQITTNNYTFKRTTSKRADVQTYVRYFDLDRQAVRSFKIATLI